MNESITEMNRQIDSYIERAESLRVKVQQTLENKYKDGDWLKKGDIIYLPSNNGTGDTFISAIVVDEGKMTYFTQNMSKVCIRQSNVKVNVLSRIPADKYRLSKSIIFDRWYASRVTTGSFFNIYSHNPRARTRKWYKQEWMEQNVFNNVKASV